MNILKVLHRAEKEAEAKQEAATREFQTITAAIGALNGHGSGFCGFKMNVALHERGSVTCIAAFLGEKNRGREETLWRQRRQRRDSKPLNREW